MAIERDPGNRRPTLVMRTGFLGDTVCAIPAFRLLRRHVGEARLMLLCDRARGGYPQAVAIAPSLDIFDDVFEYETGRTTSAFQVMRVVRMTRPSVVVVLGQRNESPRQRIRRELFFRALGVADVVSLAAPHGPVVMNEPTRLVAGLNALGIAGPKPAYDLPDDEQARQAVQCELSAHGIGSDDRYIAFCGGGKASTQRWSLTNYADTLASLARDTGVSVVALGNARELEAYRSVIGSRCPRFVTMETPSFASMIAVMRNAWFYFGNDTGPMHVAAAVGCPVAVVMSARNAAGAWDPDVSPSLVIRNSPPCEGCFLVDCVDHAHRCMTEITPARALAELLPFARGVLSARLKAFTAEAVAQ